ncbi:MAG: diacylglyceryl transferase [Candidatus Eremiobacteraeota bacterium]|nr:diacylglyceryl transferase [Candidatus Eremiobacteraeota bacterium]
MSQETFNQRLRRKWGIETEGQYWRIMMMFALAGSSCVFIRKPIFAALGISASPDGPVWWLMWFVVIFPCYQILLLFWGKVFGVFPFAWWFEKKMLRSMKLYYGPEDDGPPKLG